MDSQGYLTLGYALVWIGLAVYLFSLNRRIARVRDEVADLDARIRSDDRGGIRGEIEPGGGTSA